MLAESLKAVFTQRLLPSIDGSRMLLALEVLIGTLPLGNLIRDKKTFQLASMMQMGKNVGMQIMDEAILSLFKAEAISLETALANAENKKLFSSFMVQGTGNEPQ
jgi:twitching motility protein PilT